MKQPNNTCCEKCKVLEGWPERDKPCDCPCHKVEQPKCEHEWINFTKEKELCHLCGEKKLEQPKEKWVSDIYMAIGEISAIFMSKEIKGVDIIMPSEALKNIGDRLVKTIDAILTQRDNELVELINERFVEIINQNTECKKGMFVNYIKGLDKAKSEIINLIKIK